MFIIDIWLVSKYASVCCWLLKGNFETTGFFNYEIFNDDYTETKQFFGIS